MKKQFLWITIVMVFFSSSAAAQGLTLWIHPYLPASELIKRFTPLALYLSNEIGQPVSIRIQQSYQAHVDFVGSDNADIAYMGPVSYIKVRDQYGPKPLLAKLEVNNAPFFHGMIISRKDSELENLADLKGKKFAFGDPNSTMSHIVPRAMLAEAGVPLDALQAYDYLNSHHNVALAVMGGYFDAGGVKQEVYYEFEPQGIKMLAKSPPMAEHLFITRKNLPPELIKKLRTAFLAIGQSPDSNTIYSSINENVTNLVPVTDQNYDSLRNLLKLIEK